MALKPNPLTGELEDDGTGPAIAPGALASNYNAGANAVAASAPPPALPPPALPSGPGITGDAGEGLPSDMGGANLPTTPRPQETLAGIHQMEAALQPAAPQQPDGPGQLPISMAALPPLPMARPRGPGGGGGVPGVSSGDLKKDREDQAAAFEAQSQVARDQREIAVKNAEAQTTAAEAQAKANQDAVERRAQIQQDADERIASLEAQAQAEIEKKKQMPLTSMWADKSNGEKAVGAVAIALGALGASLSKGPNYAQQIIDSAVAQDYQMKKDRIDEQEKSIIRAGHAVDKAKEWRSQKLVEARQDMIAQREAIQDKLTVGLSKQGVAAADVAQNTTIAANQQQIIKDREAMSSHFQQLANQRAQEASARASAAASYAAAAHSRAEAEKVKKEDGAAGGGRAAGVQIQKATLAEHGQAALDTNDRLTKAGIVLTDQDLEKIQKNRKDLQGTEHMNPVEAEIFRKGHLLARTPYDGLSSEKRELAQARDVLAQKASAITSPSHDAREIEHGRQLFDLNMPGMGSAASSQTLENLRGVIGAARSLGGKYSGIAAQGAAAGRSGAPPARPQLTDVQRARLVKLLRENPNDPRAEEVRGMLTGGP